MPHPLFIYGTLHPDRAPSAIAKTARLLQSVGKATIRGRIFDLGAYPGVTLPHEDEDAGTVDGELFSIPETEDAEAILARLDDYEDFRPDDSGGSLFLRQLTTATTKNGEVIVCWVYTYNRPVF